MADRLTTRTETAKPGWAARLFHGFAARKAARGRTKPQQRVATVATNSRIRVMARQLVADERYALVLLRDAAEEVAEADAAPAWAALSEHMALIPGGCVPVSGSDGRVCPVEIAAFYLDRCTVTNSEFQRFVDAGGYDSLEIWPQEVWPSLMKFTDRSRRPGPRDWEDGRPPSGKGDHPVVGVSWYEALAYATWAGKRLPSAAEWQKASGWPEHFSGGSCTRYPWGDVFEPRRANLGPAGACQTVPVTAYSCGSTPNGLYQLTGNVWEWLGDRLDAIPCRGDERFVSPRAMRRIVGGAFDTYFPAEATNQYVTGQPELDRRSNIGFRCSVTAARLRPRR
jgi:iron(II)-dependent oxidoreductase